MSECCTASKWQRQDLNPRSFLYRIWLGRLEERFEVRAGKEFHGVHSSRKVCESVDTAPPRHPSWDARAEVPAEGDPTAGPPLHSCHPKGQSSSSCCPVATGVGQYWSVWDTIPLHEAPRAG